MVNQCIIIKYSKKIQTPTDLAQTFVFSCRGVGLRYIHFNLNVLNQGMVWVHLYLSFYTFVMQTKYFGRISPTAQFYGYAEKSLTRRFQMSFPNGL